MNFLVLVVFVDLIDLNILNILILYQGSRGGTNVVLARARSWLEEHGHNVVDYSFIEVLNCVRFDLVLLPTSEMHRLPKLLSSSDCSIGCVLVWAMGSRSFHGAFTNPMKSGIFFNIFTIPLKILASFTLNSLLNDGVVVFTDEVGLYTDVGVDRRINEVDLIFPVPIDFKSDVLFRSFKARPRRVMWVGRVDSDFKVLPLIRVIRDVSSAVKSDFFEQGVEFLIVGSGDGIDLVHQEVARTKNIEFKFIEWVSIEKLDDILIGVDMLFAMGASALQGASRGTPTVVVQPFSNKSQEVENIYRWIHRTVGHSLGEFPWFPCKPVQSNCSFEALMGFGSLADHSIKSFEFSRKFDAELIFKKMFLERCNHALSGKTRFYLYVHSMIFHMKISVKSVFVVCKKFVQLFKRGSN